MRCKWTLLLMPLFAAAATVKIAVVLGPEGDPREASDKLWSFGRNSSSQIFLEPMLYRVTKWSAIDVAAAVCSAAGNGARALLVQCPPRLSPLVASYSDNLRLPLANPLNTRDSPPGKLQLSLLPDCTSAAAALLRDAPTFAFLYDTDTGADQLGQVLRQLDPPPPVEGFWRVHGANDSFTFLSGLPHNVTHVLLATSEQLADELFTKFAARSFHGLLLRPVGIVSGTPGIMSRSTLTKFSVVDEEESGPLKEFENRWNTLEDLRGTRRNAKKLPDSALVVHDMIRVMSSIFDQLAGAEVLTPEDSMTDCFNYSAGIPASVSLHKNGISGRGLTGPLQFTEDGLRIGFTLRVVEASSYGLKKIGTWSDGSGLQIPDTSSRGRAAVAAFQKREISIRVTSILVRPFLHRDTESGPLQGYVADLVDELQRFTGHKCELRLVKDGRYGQLKDGRWNGMIGELLDNVTDLVLAPLTKTTERAGVVDFCKNFMTVGLNILLKKTADQGEGATTFGPFSFMSVWSVEVWLVLLLAAAVSGGLCYAVGRLVGAPDRVRALESKGTDSLSPCGSFWYTFGSLLQRDTGIYPRSFSHRLWAVLWWSLCFLLLVFYISSLSASLVAARSTLLTTHSTKTSQEVLEDLLQRGSPAIGTIRSGSTPQFFKNSQIGLYRDYGRYLGQHPEVLTESYAEGAARVRASTGYAFLMESLSAEYEANTPPCETLVSSGYLVTRSYAAAVQKDSHIKDMIDHSMLMLMEIGTLRRLYEKWWHNFTAYCEDPNMDILPKVYSSSMTFRETSGLFYILIVGALVSVAVALVEHYISSRRITLD